MRSGDFKERYGQLVVLAQNPASWVFAVGAVVALSLLPSFAGGYLLNLATMAGIAAIGVLGLNLLCGVAGQLSLGHAGFLALGGYAQAILVSDYGVPGWAALPLSGVLAAAASLVVGIPSLRLRGLYLALTTLAFAYIVRHLILISEDITRGSSGMPVPPLEVAGLRFDQQASFYLLVLALLVAFTLFTLNLMRSKVGRAWKAIRDHDIAASAMGISLTRYKLLAFMVSAFYAGVAGALMALHIRYVNVDNFSLLLSVEALAMIIVGGLGRTHGAIMGAIFLSLLHELIRIGFGYGGSALQALLTDRIYEIKEILYGVVILLFLRLEPEGLAGIWRKTKRFWVKWPLSQ